MKIGKRLLLRTLGLLLLLPIAVSAYNQAEAEVAVRTEEACVIELTGPQTEQQQIIDGEVTFTLSATRPGSYEYEIRQLPGDEENKIYDERIYHVILFVEAEGDTLTASISVYLDGEDTKPAEICFINEVIPPEEPDPEPEQPEQPEQPSRPGYHRARHSTTAKTGDTNTIRIWSGVLAAGAVPLGAAMVLWRKKRDRKGE